MKTATITIGQFANRVLGRADSAVVSGVASRGIYLQPGNDWTLYLSLEDFRGPLTVNLDSGSIQLDAIKTGSRVQLTREKLDFQAEELVIELVSASVWNPPGRDSNAGPDRDQIDTFHALVLEIAPDNPYLPLLSGDFDKTPGVPAIGKRMLDFTVALRSRDQDQAENTSITLLGLGPGLTPLGDDFLLGAVFALNRWGQTLDYSPELIRGINQAILQNTRIKTTRISSSLLACAAEGAADERLLVVLDGLGSGKGVSPGEIRNLLRWGNTSGITALAGMMTVLTV